MVIVTGISDRWTSWKIGPRRLLIDEKRLWRQGFFVDARSPNDWTYGAAAPIPTFDHTYVD